MITPIIFTNLDTNKYEVQLLEKGKIQAGQKDLFKISG
ncbi:hypothetical protein TMUPMC115_0500 [Tetragenococcus muriaticus PMC-11-5]|uniref:Uncharacterized protein n=1 Tax=Tetragenococcus muriaticus PMC-11-5 TaxID=1302649 RepID=A0A091C929_9ENTE|nr:hypothetical protein TMUPMC115_0500 [Tetragenococcus muriaticus PMC-11-5]